jgi:O-antigen ligase/polysaccharide polymerase Wzy-like membrane protein
MSALQPLDDPTVRRERAMRIASAGLVGLAALAAAGLGAALPDHPFQALAVLCLVPLAFGAPVLSLGVVLFTTVLVPFDVQNRLSVGGGPGVPGLLLVDVLLGLGLARVAWLVVARRLRATAPVVIALSLLVILAVALANGVASGATASGAGTEARCVVFGVGGFVLAWPLLADPAARRRLYVVLLALGVALGIWGLAQWILAFDYTTGGDVGVRTGVDLTTSGRGQLQGGLFAYPVAIALAVAALVAGRPRSGTARAVLCAILLLNAICLLLTYERTFWAAAALACLVVVLRSGSAGRRRVLIWAPVASVAVVVALAALGPGEVRTAAQRLASVSRYRVDSSVESRRVEADAVVHAISAHPVAGAGFGALITWGKRDVFATVTTPFVHDGYLWLAWKLGIPMAALLFLLLAATVVRRGPPADDPQLEVLGIGSQAALLGLLLVSVSFAVFDELGITAAMGVLAAVCWRPGALALRPVRRPGESRTPVSAG